MSEDTRKPDETSAPISEKLTPPSSQRNFSPVGQIATDAVAKAERTVATIDEKSSPPPKPGKGTRRGAIHRFDTDCFKPRWYSFRIA